MNVLRRLFWLALWTAGGLALQQADGFVFGTIALVCMAVALVALVDPL